MQSSASVAPLAWNSNLDNAASQHSAQVVQFNTQSHQLPGEADLGGRLQANGCSYNFAGENVFAFATDSIDAHAAFYINWGNTPTGMQDPPWHRNNILSANFVEVGLNATPSSDPTKTVGPLVVTEDFGNRSNYAPQVLGVVFRDSNNSHFYDAGEGLGGVTVTLTGTGGTLSTTTWSSGGSQLAAASGTYTEAFSGGGLHAAKSTQVTVTNTNVKVDDNDALSGATIAASTIHVNDASGDPIASRRVDDFSKTAQITIEAVTETKPQIARDAYRDFGKGSGHPAKLNFGDCFAYALEKLSTSRCYSKATI